MPKQKNYIYAVAVSDSSPATSHTYHHHTSSWAILVQPKPSTHWFHIENHAPTIFEPHGNYHEIPHESFLVRVLIGENAIPSITKRVEETLRHIPVAASDVWLRNALAALQSAELIDTFDTSLLMAISTNTLNKQRSNSNRNDGGDDTKGQAGRHQVVCMDYEGRPLSQDKIAETKPKGKKKGGGMWLSHGPNYTMNAPAPLRRKYSWERDDDVYGGLM